MKVFLVFACILAVAATLDVNFPVEIEAKILTGKGSSDVKFVAKEDGKYFFADATRRTWKATAAFCESMGMKLASITSSKQWSKLKASYSATRFTGYFWTSGRDALALRQFSWNATEEPLSTTYLVYSQYNSHNFQSCIAFHSVPTNFQTNLVSNKCQTGHYALCEYV